MPEKNKLIGKWRIVEMDTWGRDMLDLVEPASLTFTKDGGGTMKFIAVELWIDYRIVTRDGLPAVEFSFQGYDERDEVSGRAWAILEADRLRGRFFFHNGDDSTLVAERMRDQGTRRKTRGS